MGRQTGMQAGREGGSACAWLLCVHLYVCVLTMFVVLAPYFLMLAYVEPGGLSGRRL